MRHLFEPPALSSSDLAAFIRSATIVPDANVLLELYRLSPQAREDTMQLLERMADQLWLPYQAGAEFYRNLESTRAELARGYEDLRQSIEKLKATPAAAFKNRYDHSRRPIERTVEEAVDSLLARIEELRSNDQAIVLREDDGILSRLTSLFESRVGVAPAYDWVRRRVDEFTSHRAPNCIPPGYKDIGKDTALRAAGDYLFWSEVLDHAEHSKRPVLLLTNDTKEDWYAGPRGRATGPRPELVLEFGQRSEAGYHQMTLHRFAKAARDVLDASVAEASLDELAAEETHAATEEDRVAVRLGAEQLATYLEHSRGLLASLAPTYSALAGIVGATGGLGPASSALASLAPTYSALAGIVGATGGLGPASSALAGIVGGDPVAAKRSSSAEDVDEEGAEQDDLEASAARRDEAGDTTPESSR